MCLLLQISSKGLILPELIPWFSRLLQYLDNDFLYCLVKKKTSHISHNPRNIMLMRKIFCNRVLNLLGELKSLEYSSNMEFHGMPQPPHNNGILTHPILIGRILCIRTSKHLSNILIFVSHLKGLSQYVPKQGHMSNFSPKKEKKKQGHLSNVLL